MTLLDVFNENVKLLAEWAEDMNPENPAAFRRSSTHKAWWRCEKGHTYCASIYSRLYQKSGCPVCANMTVVSGINDLGTLEPELAAQWHPTLNGELRPEMVGCGSKKSAWWRCEKGHEWQAAVVDRAKAGHGCPCCAGLKVIPGETDIATLRPDLAKEWDYEKNGDLDPHNVAASSHKKVWWRCEKGHSWQAMVYVRSQGGSGCPYCSGSKAIPGETDLATLYPDIAKQWDYERNSDMAPHNITAYSHKKVWWLYEKGHSWQAVVQARTKIGTGCPVCAGRKKVTDTHI